MIDGIKVFDNVIHAYDMSDENLREDVPTAQVSRAHMVGALGTGRAQPPDELIRRWDVESLYDLVFNDSPTDFAMAQVVPIFDWYKNWFAPVQAQYEMSQRYPDKIMFCGGVDPNLDGLPAALDYIEEQITGMGARSMKFYNGHVDSAWDCSDRKIAYPMYERCLELGVNVLQFHKGIPFGVQNMEPLRPNDLQGAARDFPEMTVIIHHLAVPYVDETISIASRFPNVHLALSGTQSQMFTAPRRMEETMGRLLREVGASKLLWGSESPLVGSPRPYLEAFMALEIRDELMDDYGYPQITRLDKEAILGGNFARMMGVDLSKDSLLP